MPTKRREHENLSSSNISKVIKHLEDGGTKKDACIILNISYNTTRLNKIIEEHQEEQKRKQRRRDKNKGTELRPDEYEDIILMRIKGSSASYIADKLCRPLSLVKDTIDYLGIPVAPNKSDKGNTYLMPEQCIANSFEEGELVWSCVYHGIAYIKKEINNGYWMYILQSVENESKWFPGVETGGFNAFQATHDIASLRHLREYVDLEARLL